MRLPRHPVWRALVIIVGVLGVAFALTALAIFWTVTLPYRILRMKHGKRRQRSLLPQWITAVSGMIEAAALAKMSAGGVKVRRSKRDRGMRHGPMVPVEPPRAHTHAEPGDEVPF